jgi:hypothetical protein
MASGLYPKSDEQRAKIGEAIRQGHERRRQRDRRVRELVAELAELLVSNEKAHRPGKGEDRGDDGSTGK